MCKWSSSWDFFRDVPASGTRPRRVLLTTFGLDTDFLVTELLNALLEVDAERETSDWYLAMQDCLTETQVDVIVDTGEWAKGARQSLFQTLGGRVHPVQPQAGNQHAKLWLAEYEDQVRIAIGSANLTRSGFCDQIQYVWMGHLKRDGKRKSDISNSVRLKSFLDALARQCMRHPDVHGKPTLEGIVNEWSESIASIRWPTGVDIVPCIPGDIAADMKIPPMGLTLINEVLPKKKTDVKIQVFSVGSVREEFIDQLKESLRAKSLNLFWPSTTSLPPAWQGMQLDTDAAYAFREVDGCRLHQLEFDSGIVADAKSRLPHGKFYCGGSQDGPQYYQWLMIGSANLSNTAWHHSFELNVLIQGKGLFAPFVAADELTDPYCVAPARLSEPAIWLEAWQTDTGVDVTLFAPKDLGVVALSVANARGHLIASYDGTLMPGRRLAIPCDAGAAHQVRMRVSEIERSCDVIRQLDSVLADAAGGRASGVELRHRWILRKYGWRPEASRPGPFRVPWVEQGMSVFRVLDNWRSAENPMRDKDRAELAAAFKHFAAEEHCRASRHPVPEEVRLAFSIASQELIGRFG